MANGQNKIFGNIPNVLAQFAIQQQDPRRSLVEARLAEIQNEQIRSNVLSEFLGTTDLSKFKPSEILSTVTAITGNQQLVPHIADAMFQERQAVQKQSLFEDKLDALKQRANLLRGFGQDISPAEEIQAEAQLVESGLDPKLRLSPTSVKRPEDRFVKPTVAFTDRFELGSIDKFKQSQKFEDLVERPEFLESLQTKVDTEKEREPVSPTEKQRGRLIDDTVKRLQNHKFFKDEIEDEAGGFKGFVSFGFADKISLQNLAKGESEEAKQILASAPEDFLVLLDRYARFKFDIPIIERLRFRGQEEPTVPTLPSEVVPAQQSLDIQSLSNEDLFKNLSSQ